MIGKTFAKCAAIGASGSGFTAGVILLTKGAYEMGASTTAHVLAQNAHPIVEATYPTATDVLSSLAPSDYALMAAGAVVPVISYLAYRRYH